MTVVSPTPATDVAGGRDVAPDRVAAASTPTQTTASTKPDELESRANERIKQEKFNRSFTLPATDAHGELSLTYGVGGLDSIDAPTILFIGGMLGGRYLASMFDYVAMKRGMRVVVTDR
jgi:hypothetical protein